MVGETHFLLFSSFCSSEAKVIQNIVQWISNKLSYKIETNELVGISSRFEVTFSFRVKRCSLYRNLGDGRNG